MDVAFKCTLMVIAGFHTGDEACAARAGVGMETYAHLSEGSFPC